MKELLFGTAGIPIATMPRETVNGIKTVRELGLDAMELEFVQSINISKEKAPEIKKAAEESKIPAATIKNLIALFAFIDHHGAKLVPAVANLGVRREHDRGISHFEVQ